MTSAPVPDHNIRGNWTSSEKHTLPICATSTTLLIFLRIEKKFIFSGFDPQASQDRANIIQPALLDLQQMTILIKRINKNSLINNRTGWSINKLSKSKFLIASTEKDLKEYLESTWDSFDQFHTVEF